MKRLTHDNTMRTEAAAQQSRLKAHQRHRRAAAVRQTFQRVRRCAMLMTPLTVMLTAALLIAGLFLPSHGAMAQGTLGADDFGQAGEVFGGINFGGLSQDMAEEPIVWQAKYYASGEKARLEIEAKVGHSWHVYSTTQPEGGPLPTKFRIVSPKTVSVVGPFQPDEPPAKSVSEIYPGVTIEEHEGVVRWSAPLQVPVGFQNAIEVDVKALACQSSGSCMPANETLTVAYAGPLKNSPVQTGASPAKATTPAGLLAAAGAKAKTFRDDEYEVTWRIGVSSSIAAGKTGQLVFQAQPESDFHVYQGVVDDTESSTNFVVVDKAGLKVGGPEPDQPVISKSLLPPIPGLPETPPVKFHQGTVTWSLPVQVPADAEAGEHKIKGFVCYQACTDKSCLQPMAFQFVATVLVADKTAPELKTVEIESSKFAAAIDQAAETKWVDSIEPTAAPPTAALDSGAPVASDNATDNATPPAVSAIASAERETDPTGESGSATRSADLEDGNKAAEEEDKASLPLILLMALGGGLILNLMPCVLPVVGLKIMSFMAQAGEDRKRVFALNFAYVAGILAVFAGLTVLAVFASFGWGQQFTYFPVRLGLTVMIFALALSYLGVWELPTPGIAAGETSQGLQEREGLTGAFFKGAFATILATPCSGPLLGVVLGYTISLQPIETAAVMMTVGLGMSLPYIILGMFPSAISFMPKPGNWMVTLKEFMAFLFLGTVAFFFNQFSDSDKLPVFVTLIGVWFGCWIIGKVPPWESIDKRLRGWTLGVVSAVAIGWFAFMFLAKPATPTDIEGGIEYIVDSHLRWERYDEARLEQLQAEGKTVMLDFTAAWCTNCFVNKKVALDTEATRKLLDRLGGVAMLADWTDQDDEIESKLRELDSKSIPVLAIYPGEKPERPIVLRDLVTQATVLDALQEAGPSREDAAVASKRDFKGQLTSTTSRSARPVGKQSH